MGPVDEGAPYSAFVPQLSINRSSELLYNRTISDNYGSRAGASVNAPAVVVAAEDSGGWMRWNANSSVRGSSRSRSRHSHGRYHQSPFLPHNGLGLFGAVPSSASWTQPNAVQHGNTFEDGGGNLNVIANNRNGGMGGRYARDTNFGGSSGTRGGGPHVARDAPPPSTSWCTSPRARITRMLRHEAEQSALNQPPSSSLNDLSSSHSSAASTSSNDESTLFDIDTDPVVPEEIFRSSQSHTFVWSQHPCHTIVLSLLRSRGMFLPQHVDLVKYHCPEIFLQYISLCCSGAYFIRYQATASPKERFFSVRMLPRDTTSRSSYKVPYLIWRLHRAAVQVAGCIPLEQLVGITVNARSISFRPHLITMKTIKGPRADGHRIKLPTEGAFSLWFFDRYQRTAKSVDLLTCNPTVLEVWVKTFKGFLSVNSSSIVQVSLKGGEHSTELDELAQMAQQQVASHTRLDSSHR